MTPSSDSLSIEVKVLPHGEGLPLPHRATRLSAGLDLSAAIKEDHTLEPGQRFLVPSGHALSIPEGYEAQIRARSGLSYRHGLAVLNAPGTIDADYRGEIKILLINHGDQPFTITRGMRVAQLVIAPVALTVCVVVDQLSDSERNTGGFGSTGLKAVTK